MFVSKICGVSVISNQAQPRRSGVDPSKKYISVAMLKKSLFEHYIFRIQLVFLNVASGRNGSILTCWLPRGFHMGATPPGDETMNVAVLYGVKIVLIINEVLVL